MTPAFRLPAIALVLAALGGCMAAYEVPQEPPLTRSLTAAGAQVDPAAAASLFNDYRRANGLGPLSVDPVLQRVALAHAREMAGRQKVGHDVGSGQLDVRVGRAGYAYARVAENVAAGYHSLAEAFSGWRDSRDHNRNMLNPDVTQMGIAIAQAPGSKYKVYWAMVVARPDTGERRGGPPLLPAVRR